jgi:hypothetical protein
VTLIKKAKKDPNAHSLRRYIWKFEFFPLEFFRGVYDFSLATLKGGRFRGRRERETLRVFTARLFSLFPFFKACRWLLFKSLLSKLCKTELWKN